MYVHGKYFYGNEISEYGQEHGYVDYGTLAKSFDAVLNNDIMQKTWDVVGYWEQESGFTDNTEKIEELQEKIAELDEKKDNLHIEQDNYINLPDKYFKISEQIENIKNEIAELEEEIEELENEYNDDEIYQYFIVDDNGAEILKECGEIVFYNDALDMYVWGVTHWGTSWDYVLTDIKCNVPYDEE